MKKKLFYGFIVSLFVFTLFISVSKAFPSNQVLVSSGNNTYKPVTTIDNVAIANIFPDIYNKYLFPDDETINLKFEEQLEFLYEKTSTNAYFMYSYLNSSSQEQIGFYFFDSSLTNVGVVLDDDGSDQICFEILNNANVYCLRYGIPNNSIAGYCYGVSGGTRYLTIIPGEIFDIFSSTNLVVYSLTYNSSDTSISWDGVSYYSQAPSEPEVPEIPKLTGEEMKAMIDKLQASDDYNKMLPRGYGDFFIVYNHIVNNYYAYVYPTKFSLAYRYYDWIEEQERYMANGQTSGDAISFMKYDEFDGFSFQQLWDNWNTLLNSFNNFDYYCFRLSSNGETFLYSTQYDSSQSGTSKFYFATNEESIVYSSKRLYLLINDGVLGTDFDIENTIDKTIITDSSGNEIEVTVQETEGEENFWNSLINKVIAPIKEFLAAFKEANNIGLRFSPFLSGTEFNSTGIYILFLMLDVFLASFALVTRFAVFVFSLPTIEATSSLLPASVVQGLEWFKALNWNGLSFWVLFESFVLAISAVFVVRIVRRFYRL